MFYSLDHRFHRIGNTVLSCDYFPFGNLEDCERRSRISIKHAPGTTRIDKMNPVDYFVIGCMRVAHDMNSVGSVLRQCTKAGFRGVWKERFVFVIIGSVEYADTDIAEIEIRLPG